MGHKMTEQLWDRTSTQTTCFSENNATSYEGPSILVSDNEDFTDISHLLSNDDDIIERSDRNYTVNVCNNKVGFKIIITLAVVFTFFLVICFLVYREALATSRAVEYMGDQEELDSFDLITDYTE